MSFIGPISPEVNQIKLLIWHVNAPTARSQYGRGTVALVCETEATGDRVVLWEDRIVKIHRDGSILVMQVDYKRRDVFVITICGGKSREARFPGLNLIARVRKGRNGIP